MRDLWRKPILQATGAAAPHVACLCQITPYHDFRQDVPVHVSSLLLPRTSMRRWARAACRYPGLRKAGCAASLVYLAIGRSDGITILGDLLATYLPYFMCSMPIVVKAPTGPIVAHVLLLVRGCASWHRNQVLQSAEPKEAVVQRESLEFMSHEATEMRLAVSGTIWIRSSAESAVVVLSHTWLTASSSHGAENNGARQQRRRRAVGETRVRASPHGTHGSPP